MISRVFEAMSGGLSSPFYLSSTFPVRLYTPSLTLLFAGQPLSRHSLMIASDWVVCIEETWQTGLAMQTSQGNGDIKRREGVQRGSYEILSGCHSD